MIIADIHSHIVPQIDDGSTNLDDSIEMLTLAYKSGTRHIVATSHFGGQGYFTDNENIIKYAETLSDEMKKRDMNLKVYPGHEFMFSEECVNHLIKGKINTINNNGFLLFELPFDMLLQNIAERIFSFQDECGVEIIMAHIERYDYFYKNFNIIEKLVDNGIFIQINGDSLRGKNGKMAKKLAEKLLRYDMVHFISSDMHNTSTRAPQLDDIYLKLRKDYGGEFARRLMYENPMRVISGEMPV